MELHPALVPARCVLQLAPGQQHAAAGDDGFQLDGFNRQLGAGRWHDAGHKKVLFLVQRYDSGPFAQRQFVGVERAGAARGGVVGHAAIVSPTRLPVRLQGCCNGAAGADGAERAGMGARVVCGPSTRA